MNYDEFIEKYKPIQNPFCNAPFDGMTFETYGDEIDFVKLQDKNKICTIIDENDDLYIIDGYHFINRLGYFILNEPCYEEINILID